MTMDQLLSHGKISLNVNGYSNGESQVVCTKQQNELLKMQLLMMALSL
jgi:hypothetical protein